MEKALLKPLLSLEDLVRFSGLESGSGESLRALLQRGQEAGSEWPGIEHANIGPYIQKMLAAAGPFKGTPNTFFPQLNLNSEFRKQQFCVHISASYRNNPQPETKTCTFL